jgi:hypothetical protein
MIDIVDTLDLPNQAETGCVRLPSSNGATSAPQGVELRHLRYFVAAADAGNQREPPGCPPKVEEPANPARVRTTPTRNTRQRPHRPVDSTGR